MSVNPPYVNFNVYLAEKFQECDKQELQEFITQNFINNCYYVILNKGNKEFEDSSLKSDYFEQLNTQKFTLDNLRADLDRQVNKPLDPKDLRSLREKNFEKLGDNSKNVTGILPVVGNQDTSTTVPDLNNVPRPEKEPDLSRKTTTQNFFKLTSSLGDKNLLKNYVIAKSSFSTNFALNNPSARLSEMLNDKQMSEYLNLKAKMAPPIKANASEEDKKKRIQEINDKLNQFLTTNLQLTGNEKQAISSILKTGDWYLAGGAGSDDERDDLPPQSSKKKTNSNAKRLQGYRNKLSGRPVVSPSSEVTPNPAIMAPSSEGTPNQPIVPPSSEVTPNQPIVPPSSEVTPNQPIVPPSSSEVIPDPATKSPSSEVIPDPATKSPSSEVTPNQPIMAPSPTKAAPEENKLATTTYQEPTNGGNNYDGANIFIFKLDINEDNEFNNKNIFNNICAGNYVGVGDYVKYPNQSLSLFDSVKAGIIESMQYLDSGKTICLIRPVNTDTLEPIGNTLDSVDVSYITPFDEQKKPLKPIKYINGIIINLNKFKTLIENANNLVANTVSSENRLMQNKYGKNGLILSNLLQEYQDNNSLTTLLFLLANKIGYNILGNVNPVKQGVKSTRQDAKQMTDDESSPNTIRDEIPTSIYLSTFTKLLFDILYKSNNGILYKTARMHSINNGECSVTIFERSTAVSVIKNVTIYEKNFNGMLNNSTQTPTMFQLSSLFDKYSDCIRFILLYFSSPSSGNYFGCKIENYYNSFTEKLNTFLALYITKRRKEYQKYLRDGKTKDDIINFGKGAYDSFTKPKKEPLNTAPSKNQEPIKEPQSKPSAPIVEESKPAAPIVEETSPEPSATKPSATIETTEPGTGGYKRTNKNKKTRKIRKSRKNVNKKRKNITKKKRSNTGTRRNK